MFARWTLALITVALLTSRGDAQPASAQAEGLFRQAKEQMAAKKYAEACASFDASQKLDPAVTTLLNQADCREKNQQLTTAWGLFVEAERQTRSSKDKNDAQLNKVAKERARKLEPRLSKLTINVAAPAPGMQVLRNAVAVDDAVWNRRLEVDGGTYTISAKAPGFQDWSTKVTVAAEGDAKVVDVPKLEPAKVAATKPGPASPIVVAEPTPAGPRDPNGSSEPPIETRRSSSKVVPIALGVAAVALGGTAIVFELSARKTYDEAVDEFDDAKQDSLWKTANRKRYLAEGLGVAGIACAGVAVWMFVRSGSSASSSSASLITPTVAPDQIGFAVSGHY